MRVLSKRSLRADMMAANLNADWRYVHRQPALNAGRSLGGALLWHPRDHTRRLAFFDRWLFLADDDHRHSERRRADDLRFPDWDLRIIELTAILFHARLVNQELIAHADAVARRHFEHDEGL